MIVERIIADDDLEAMPHSSRHASLIGTCRALCAGMPYATNSQLPDRIRTVLPQHAQDIFRAAFNAAYERYGPSHEDKAFRIAWGAVKRSYVHRSARLWIRRRAQA